MLGPDGSVVTPPVSASSSDSQKGKNNSKKSGSGFGSISQWSGPGRGAGPGGRISDPSSSASSGHNGKDAAMLSDLPRKVCVCGCVCFRTCVHEHVCVSFFNTMPLEGFLSSFEVY